jgi:dolichol-phosphate mannosyltransferase
MATYNPITSTDFEYEFDPAPTNLALSIIVPTRNEAGNVEKLLAGIHQSVADTPVEVIFVDDSTDETPQVVAAAVGHFPELNVRLLHRPEGQRTGGLGGAVVLGLKAAKSDYACVMDGDLQHPPSLLPVMLNTVLEKGVDLVVATRRSDASQVTGLNTARNQISRGLDLAARFFFPFQLRGVSDPLAGFFLVRVAAINIDALRPNGFKILLDMLVRNPRLTKAEVPFQFGERYAGQSKASAAEAWKYLNLLIALRFGEGFLRFSGFALVGLSGILVNSLILYLATSELKIFYLLSVVIATLGSTLWNFSLTEALVYRSKDHSKGRLRRLILFSAMNTLALGLRGPVIYILTSLIGINYLISNLASLVVLTLLRFTLADNIIWGKVNPAEPATPAGTRVRWELKKVFSYNVQNIVTVVSEGELPELEPFKVSSVIAEPTIRVRIGIPRPMKPGEDTSGQYLRFREVFGHLGFEVGIQMGEQVDVVASPSLRLSPHVLYTNVVEPILRWTFVKKGYALVHGATIAFGQDAYMITARTDTGKTTTLLKILSHQRRDSDQAAFLSDDMTIVSPNGIAMTYPKPLTISAHTLRAINSRTLTFKERLFLPLQSRIHSRTGRQVASFIGKTHLPSATINTLVQMLIPPPKYFVEKLVPKVKLTRKAQFAGLFIIERGEQGIRPIENEEALQILLSNCEDAYGFPPYNDLKEFLYFNHGEDLRVKEQAIIRQALGGLPSHLIRSSTLEWWCQIPTFVNEQVANDCACGEPRARLPLQAPVRSM